MLSDELQNVPPPPKEDPPPQWMISLADLLSLMLTFFVLLYSMSALDTAKWNRIVQSLSFIAKPQQKPVIEPEVDTKRVPSIHLPEAVDLKYLTSVLQDKFKDAALPKDSYKIFAHSDTLVIRVNGDAFAAGEAALNDNARTYLAALSDALSAVGNHIDVIGSATSEELKPSVQYPSLWELALGRATAVSQALRNNGYPYKITAFGRAGASALTADAIQVGERTGTVSAKAPADKPTGEKREESPRRVDIVIRTYPAEL